MTSTSSASSSSKQIDTDLISDDLYSDNELQWNFDQRDNFTDPQLLLIPNKKKKRRYNKKKISKNSFVWSFFDLVEFEDDNEIVTKIKCTIEGCEAEYTWHNSTSNMINHLRDIHQITKMSLENKPVEELKKPLQQTLETVLSKPHSKQKQQKLTRDIIKLFLSCTLPLSLIENENFRTFLNSIDPRYKPPCINTLKNEISDAAYHTIQNIKYIINTQTDMIAFTFDLWTSRAHDSYLGLTCHWISDEFKIYDFTLCVTEIGEYKTADNIVSIIEPVLNEFGISGSKIISITTDNGTNVKAAVSQLSTKLSVSNPIANIFCAAHTLQLSVNAGLDVAEALIIKCKTLIRLLGGEKKRKQLRQAQIKTGKNKSELIDVIQDVETRWNSTYMALKRLTKLERPIKWLVNDLENSTNSEYRRDGSKIRDKMLSNEEFEIIRVLVDLLYPFDKATEIISGSNYATLSIIVPTIEELINRLNNMSSEYDIILNVKNTIRDNIIRRWLSPHKYGLYASFLDPRFKNLTFCSSVSI
jgi:hypothetical protein